MGLRGYQRVNMRVREGSLGLFVCGIFVFSVCREGLKVGVEKWRGFFGGFSVVFCVLFALVHGIDRLHFGVLEGEMEQKE